MVVPRIAGGGHANQPKVWAQLAGEVEMGLVGSLVEEGFASLSAGEQAAEGPVENDEINELLLPNEADQSEKTARGTVFSMTTNLCVPSSTVVSRLVCTCVCS